MHTERRTATQRIDVSRPVELLNREGAEITAGFTRNLCEGGLRARVEDLSETHGANLLIRLYLEDGHDPVIEPARIVWCARDLYGEGAEVGLRLVDGLDDPGPEPRGADDRAAVPPAGSVLAEGQLVEVNSGGLILAATVIAIEPPDAAGNLRVSMRVLGEAADPPDEFDPELWKARPIRDAVSAVRRHAGPVIRWIVAALAVAGRILAPVLRKGWSLLPAGARAGIERFAARIAGSRAVLTARRLALSVAAGVRQRSVLVGARLAVWRASRLAVRGGD
jgi:hypothetical protein